MKEHTEYVVGFLFSVDESVVALITKSRPTWQRGLKNGIGWHVEDGELALDAMRREILEETGGQSLDWKHKIVLRGGNYMVDF